MSRKLYNFKFDQELIDKMDMIISADTLLQNRTQLLTKLMDKEARRFERQLKNDSFAARVDAEDSAKALKRTKG